MRGNGNKIEYVWIAVLAIVVCATVALWPLVHSEFVYYDDDVYIQKLNPTLARELEPYFSATE